MDYCRAAEAASSQLKEISSHGPDTVIYLSKSKKGTPHSQLQSRAQPKLGRNIASSANKEMTRRDCKYCGWRHKRKKEECPAFGKTCHSCEGKDHFSNVCQQQIQPGNKASSHSNLHQSKLECMSYTKMHQLHPRMNFGPYHSLKKFIVFLTIGNESIQPWKLERRQWKCR